MLETVVGTPLALPARQVAVSAAGRHATTSPQRAELARRLCGVLLSLPERVRDRLLAPGGDAVVVGGTVSAYTIPPCRGDCCAPGVASAAAELLAKSAGDAVRPTLIETLQLLAAAAESAVDATDAAAATDAADAPAEVWQVVLGNAATDLKQGMAACADGGTGEMLVIEQLSQRIVTALFTLCAGKSASDEPIDELAYRWFAGIEPGG